MNKSESMTPWIKNAVLIYGPRKAGTTLLSNLHDGGDELVVYPSELKIKFFANYIWNNSSDAMIKYFNESLILNKDLPNFDKEGYKKYVKNINSNEIQDLKALIEKDILGVYQNILDKPDNPSMWAIKEVGGNTRQVIGFWKHLFYNSRIVMIVREPSMVTRSVILDRRRKKRRLDLRQIYKQVIDPIRRIVQELELLSDKNSYVVTYEELVSDPVQTIKGICDFLKISYKDILRQPTIFGKRVITTTASKQTKDVFLSQKKWFHDLTLRKKTAVWSFTIFIKLIFKYYRGITLKYSEIEERIIQNRVVNFSKNQALKRS